MIKRLWWSFTDYIRETDKLLILLCTVATSFGCIAVLSSTRYLGSYRRFFMQVGCMLAGLILSMIVSSIDYANYRRGLSLIIGVPLALTLLTFLIGSAPTGTDAKAWLVFAGVSFQPSELLKIAFAITFSLHLSAIGDKINRISHLFLVLLHGAFPVMLIHLQGDDGTALVFACMMLVMLIMSGLKGRFFAIFGGIVAVAAPVLYFFVLSDYQKSRIVSMFNLEADLQGIGYQQWRGRIALASGGMFGKGLFSGPLTQSGNVPKGYNDFIFVSIGEELGFVGCLAVILLLLFICLRILYVGMHARDAQGTLMCAGIFAMFLAQIVVNLGMCLSLLPVIGITLPFFSSGGTSLLCLFLGIGTVLSVYLHKDSNVIRVSYD